MSEKEKLQNALDNLRKTAMKIADVRSSYFPLAEMEQLKEDATSIQKLINRNFPIEPELVGFGISCYYCHEHFPSEYRHDHNYCPNCGQRWR